MYAARRVYGPGVVLLAGKRATAPYGRHRAAEIRRSLTHSLFLSLSHPRTGIVIFSGTSETGRVDLERHSTPWKGANVYARRVTAESRTRLESGIFLRSAGYTSEISLSFFQA